MIVPPAKAGNRSILLWLPVALFIAIVGFQLFGPVPIGLANNGDFPRILGSLRLWPAASEGRHYYFVNDYVVADPRWNSGIPSSEWFVAALAKRIARVALPTGTFKLSLMGLLHGAILGLAVFIFLNALRNRAWWLRLVCGLFLILIWSDITYVQQLSTAYTDAGAVVSLCLAFSIAVQCVLVGGAWPWALGFALCGSFLIATKTQHQTALPALIAFCLLIAFRERRKLDRIAWLAAPLLLLITSVSMIRRTPQDFRTPPAFTIVFYKLAPLAPNPKTVLADFHMPEDEFLKYVGHYWYEPIVPGDDPEFKSRILRLVSPATLASFYLRHPAMLWKVLLFDLHESAPDILLVEYGHVRETDLHRGAHPFELTAWSGFRTLLCDVDPNHLIWLFALAIVLAAFRWSQAWPLLAFSVLLALTAFPFASLLDAAETARHLVFFQAATDLTMFSIVFAALLQQEALQENMKKIPKLIWIVLAVIVLLWVFRGPATRSLAVLKGAHTVEDVSGEIGYSGKWTHGVYPSATNGTTSFSNEPGSSARIWFRGTGITWFYAKAFNRGIASVKIDGVSRDDVDLYSSTIVWQASTTFDGLKPGVHTLELTVSGRKDADAKDRYIDLDAFVIR